MTLNLYCGILWIVDGKECTVVCESLGTPDNFLHFLYILLGVWMRKLGLIYQTTKGHWYLSEVEFVGFTESE